MVIENCGEILKIMSVFFRIRPAMNRADITTLIAAHAGKLVETALRPETRPEELAQELRLMARILEELANELDSAPVSDGKWLSLQQELERRVGVLTEWGPLQTTLIGLKTDPPANHAQS